MAEGIKTFGSKRQKGEEMLRILTPTDQAMGGGVDDVLKDFMANSDARLIGSFFASMVTGEKITTASFDSLKASVASKSSFNKLNNTLNLIYDEIAKPSTESIKGHVTNISKNVQTISDALINYLAAAPSEGGSEGKMTYNIVLDTTQAENFDKILKQITELQPDNVKNVEKIFSAANNLAFIDMSTLKTNFIDPFNTLSELKVADIQKAINEGFIESNLIENLQLIFLYLSDIEFENQSVIDAFLGLDKVVETLISFGNADLEELKLVPSKLEAMMSIFDSKNNINDIIKQINELDSLNPDSVEAFRYFGKATAYLLIFSDGLDDKNAQDILDSIVSFSQIIDTIKNKIEFSSKDADKLKSSVTSLNACLEDLSKVALDSESKAEAIAEASTKITSALEKTGSESSKNSKIIDSLFNGFANTQAKMEEFEDVAKQSNNKHIIVQVEDLGKVILAIGALLVIGSIMLKKDPQVFDNAKKFAVTMALFAAITLTPIVLIGGIASLLKTSGPAVEALANTVIKLGFVLVAASIIYKWVGDDLSKYARKFTIDLTLFLLGIAIVVPLLSFGKDTLKNADKLAMFVTKAATIMMLGALFVMLANGRFAKASLLFGVVFALFIALTLLPVKLILKNQALFGLITGKDSQLDALAKYLIAASSIMIIGALFILLGNGKFAKAALLFGVVLAAFIFIVLLPIKMLTGGGFFSKMGTGKIMQEFTYFIVSATLVLLVGGIFMTIGNGKYGNAAIKFALLLSGFIFLVAVAIKMITKHVTLATIFVISRFKALVESFAIMLIVGGLFMNMPGMAKNAIKFAALVSVFTIVMAGVMVIVAKLINNRVRKSLLYFSLSVLLLTYTIVLAIWIGQKYSFKDMLKAGLIILMAAGVFIGFAFLLGNPLVKNLVNASLKNIAKIAIGLALFGIAIGIVAFVTKLIIWKDLLKLTVILATVIGLFALLAIPYVAAVIGIGGTVFMLMGVGLLIMGIAFMIIHKLVNTPGIDLQDDINVLMISVQALIEGLANITGSGQAILVILGVMIVSVLLIVTMTALSISFLLLHFIVGNEKMDIVADSIKLHDSLQAFLDAFEMFTGDNARDSWLKLGAALAASLMIGVIGITLAATFGLLRLSLIGDPESDMVKLQETIAAMADALVVFEDRFAMTAIGQMFAKERKVDLAATLIKALEIGIIGVTLSATFGLLRLAVVGDPKADMEKLKDCINGVAEVLGLIDERFAMTAIGSFFSGGDKIDLLGLLVKVAELGTILLALGIPINLISKTANFIQQNNVDPATIGLFIERFADVMARITDDKKYDWNNFYKKVWHIAFVCTMMSFAISRMAVAVNDVANLKIATEWNKDGKPIDYRQMNESDFENVVVNVEHMFEAIFRPFTNIYKNPEYKEIIDAFAGTSFWDRIFGTGSGEGGRVLAAISLSFKLSRLVGSLASNIANIAKLMIPTDWNDAGVAIDYRTMNENDFNAAGHGIQKILLIMVEAIQAMVTDPIFGPLLDDYIKNDSKWFGLSKGNSKLGAAISLSFSIAELVGTMAETIGKFAELKFPIAFDSQGNATDFITIGSGDFSVVKQNIMDVMSIVMESVSSALEGGDGKPKGWFENLYKKLMYKNGSIDKIKNVVTIVGEMAKLLCDISNLTITTYDVNGKENGKRNFSPEDAAVASDVIQIILTTIPSALQRIYKDNKALFDDEETTKKIIKAIQPTSEIMKNLIDVISGYANLSYPIKWDKDGKPIEFARFDPAKDIEGMKNVFNTLLTCIAKSLIDVYNGGLKDLLEDANFKNVGKTIKQLIESVSSIIDAVQKTIELKIPIYKGDKITGYKQLINDPEAAKNLETVLTDLINSVMNAIIHTGAKLEIILMNPVYKKAMNVTGEIADDLSKIIKTISSMYELKIPKGPIDKDGKCPSGYWTINTMDATKVEATLTSLFKMIPNAIVMAYNDLNNSGLLKTLYGGDGTNFDKPAQDSAFVIIGNIMKSSLSVIKDVYEIVSNVEKFKIPTGFDKDGKPKGFVSIATEGFDKVTKQIANLLQSIPNALVDSYESIKAKSGVTDDLTLLKYVQNVGTVLTKVSIDIMRKVPDVINAYIDIKESLNNIKSNEIKTNVGGFLKSIATMYMEILSIFASKDAKETANDINAAYANISLFINQEAIQKMFDLSLGLYMLSIPLDEIKDCIVNSIVPDLNAINDIEKPNYSKLMFSINSAMNIMKALNENIDNVKFVKLILETKRKLLLLTEITEQFANYISNISTIASNIKLLNQICENLDYSEETKSILLNKCLSNVDFALQMIQSTNNDIDIFKSLNANNKSFDVLVETFDNYRANIEQIIDVFKKLENSLAYTGINSDQLEQTQLAISNVITSMKSIISLVKSSTLTNDTMINVPFMSFIKSSNNEKELKEIVSDFVYMSEGFRYSMLQISNGLEDVESLSEASFANLDRILNIVWLYTNNVTDDQVEKFSKESESIEKFTKAINNLNIAKIDRLQKLFDSMEKWSSSIGNLDEFTHALADELSETLAKLTNEIVDAKKVIKTADSQRKKRQEQLNDSIEKIEKLMNKTLHVNVSQDNGKTISGAWEKPD